MRIGFKFMSLLRNFITVVLLCCCTGMLSAQTNPGDFSSLFLWYSGDSISGTGTSIDTLYDLSGNGHHASQSNNNYKPVVSHDSLFFYYPVLSFDGSNDFLYAAFDDTIPQPNTVFVLWNLFTDAGSPSLACDGAAETGRRYIGWYNGNGNININGGAALYYSKELPVIPIVTTAIFNADTSKIYENSVLKKTGNAGQDSVADLFVGRGSWGGGALKGDIAEILFFDTVLNDMEQQQIENYLYNKYAPPVNLGSDISIAYGFCDTSIMQADKPWFESFAWNTGEETSGITVNQSGLYAVTVTDVFGFTSSDGIFVDYPGDKLSDTTICAGDSISLDIGLGANYSFLWSDGSSDSTLTVFEDDDYWVSVTDSLGCSMVSDTIHVSVDSFPMVDVLPDFADYCNGELLGLDTIPANVTFLWNTGSTDSTTIISGSDDYSIEIINETNCVLTDTITVNVIGTAPTADFTFDTVCYGLPTSFTDLSEPEVDIVTWEWDFDDGTYATEQNPVHVFPEHDTFTVTLTVSTLNCTHVVSKEVFCKPLPSVDFSTFWGNYATCTNTDVQFINESTGYDAMDVFYEWHFDDGTFSTETNPIHAFNDTGTFEVQLTASQDNGCMDSLSKEIIVSDDLPPIGYFDLFHPLDNTYLEHQDSILFSWNVQADAVYVDLVISKDSTFNDIIISEDSLITTELYVSLPSDVDTAYWKIIAYNDCFEPSHSEFNRFFIFTPEDISNLYFWIAGDSVNETVSYVDTVFDLSGNDLHAAQSNNNFKPVVSYDSSFFYYPVLSFDGSNDFLYTAFDDTISQPNTVFVLWSTAEDDSGISLACDGSTSTGRRYIGWSDNDIIINGGASLSYSKELPVIPIVTTAIFNADTSKIFENSVLKKTGNAGTDSVADLFIGRGGWGGGPLKGDIAEILLFDTVLTDTQQQQIENYLYNKYAPPVNLGFDIHTAHFCDTTITAADKPWFTDYMWNTGSTDSVITVSETGEYSVTVTDIFGFTSEDDIRVVYPGVSQPDAVSEICYGDTLQWAVDLAEEDYSFAWYNSPSTGNSAEYWENTQAAVEITDSLGCKYRSDTISVQVDMFEFTAGFGTQDTALCIGNRLTFLYGDDDAVSYEWQDGSTDDEFLIEGPGTYHATVTNDLGCVAVDTVDVSILGTVPEPDFFITGHCAGSSISLADSSTSPDGTITMREWIYNDTVFATGEQASISFDSAGNYDITLQIYTDVGCHNTLTQTVEVHPLPVPDFAPLTGCEGNEIFFENLSTIESDDIAFTRWKFFDGDEYHTNGAGGASHTYDSAGMYNVTMEAVSDWDCADQITQAVEINPSPAADFAHSAACSGQPVFFSSQSSSDEPWNPVINISWDFGDGTTSTSNSPEHIYNNTGLYDMELVATALNGCTDTMHYTIDVHHSPEAIATNLNACAGTPHVLTDSSVAGGDSIILWNWQVDTLEFTNQHPGVTMQDTGTYPLSLKVATEHGCIDEMDSLLYVWENPVADFSMPRDWGEVPFDMALENTSEGATTYHWDFGDGSVTDEENPVHTWLETGTYEIQLVAVSDKSCTDTATGKLRVVVPMVDLVVINVRAEMDGNFLIVEADIGNAGTVPVENPAIELNTATGSRHREVLDHGLDAGDVETYAFTTQPYIPDGNLPEYVCVFIDPVVTDVAPENNEHCILNEAGFRIYNLYPNPVSGNLNIAMLMPADGKITTEIFDASGRLVFNKTTSLTAGYHVLSLDCTEFSIGRYTLRMRYDGDVEIRGFLVE